MNLQCITNKKQHLSFTFGLLLLGTLSSCQLNEVECDANCQMNWIDGGNHKDTCLSDTTGLCLVSKQTGDLSDSVLASPVIIAVHGFSTSTFEWREFKEYADSLIAVNTTDQLAKNPPRVSLVLLGGHGRGIGAFQSSTWQDWGKPILTEYDALVARGYQNISFAVGSTGATLLLEYIADGYFNTRRAPNRIYMIDPIIVPTSKALSLIELVGPVVGNFPDEGTKEENYYWYVNRPEEDLKELYKLINGVKNKLESGITLPKKTLAKVFKSIHDGSADPVGAMLIYDGLTQSNGSKIEVKMVDSRLHMFTRLRYRSSALTAADTSNQRDVFKEITDSVRVIGPRL